MWTVNLAGRILALAGGRQPVNLAGSLPQESVAQPQERRPARPGTYADVC